VIHLFILQVYSSSRRIERKEKKKEKKKEKVYKAEKMVGNDKEKTNMNMNMNIPDQLTKENKRKGYVKCE
jgi:hypothetical protein